MDAAPFAVITVDHAGQVMGANAEARRQFRTAATPGAQIGDLFDPECAQTIMRAISRGQSSGPLRGTAMQACLQLEIWLATERDFSALYIYDVGEAPESRAVMTVFFDSAPVGLGFWDRRLRYQRVNRALAEISGLSPEDHVGRSVKDVAPGLEAVITRALRRVLESGTSLLDQETTGYTPSQPGVLRYWSISYYPIRLGGRVVGAGAVCEDITRLRQAEAEIARSLERERRARSQAQAAERRAAFLAQAAAALASSLDYQSTIANVVRLAVPDVADWAAVDMLDGGGRMRRLALARLDHNAVELAEPSPDSEPLPTDALLAKVIETGQSQMVAHVADGLPAMWKAVLGGQDNPPGFQPQSWMIVPIRAPGGKVIGAIRLVTADSGRQYEGADLRLADELADRVAVAIQNATLFAEAERRRVEAEAAVENLRLANSDLEQFAHLTSHDLQEPLRTVASFAQLLERRHARELPPEARDYIGHIVEGARRMSHLIHDLLEYSHVSRAEGPKMAAVDMESLLEQCVQALQADLQASGGVITHDPLPVLRRANNAQMQQVLLNLLSNSLKYARENEPPVVHVSAARKPEGWEFSVRDNGRGFDPQFHERIFGVFKRLHGREIPGTGMGLALCRRIVERHGGQIRAESSPGGGATFYFTIPD